MCFVRKNEGEQMLLTTYGRSSGFMIDPIEKKPLNHFFPGTSVLSFGTAGCNLACDFCQNWDISKSREMDTLSSIAFPEQLAKACTDNGCHSIAFTYNDPVIFLEYALDTAIACREVGVKTVAVTAGYITKDARKEFFSQIDAANVDLKAFTSDFYRNVTKSELQPVLDTLLYVKHETNVWLEITTLLIPNLNDSNDEIRRLSNWVLENLGPSVPLHFSAFHPDFRMRNVAKTPKSTLQRARKIARQEGLRHVYTGNVHDRSGDTTFCPHCQAELIVRDWYEIEAYRLEADCCSQCGGAIAGRFAETPGDWGRKRLRIIP